ncbi:MAG: hypothetical protein AVDCRST_MAG86-2184 [uncultured Truepera sp.]|uniref:SnoaL-like domain-containing protein n=1 Tax=uncultured Truepera sp. TaxID=543023 RepID=A0A6J4VCE0_9DEIN|nr:MAG: hypothetical protein AVDCRST_MAG86-2184 [uncultured Truepera sp.]
MPKAPKEIVKQFWQTMNTNDFEVVGLLLADDYTLEWPQSREIVRGRDNFIRVNQNYPASGTWRFTVYSSVAEGAEVVSDVGVADGVVNARAITFATVEGGLSVKQVEF